MAAAQGDIVIYHAPGGANVPAVVVDIVDDTTYIMPIFDSGQAVAEGTEIGQYSTRA